MCETEALLNEAHCFHEVYSWWRGLDQFSLTTGSFFYPSVLQPNRGNELNSLLTSQCKSLCLYPYPTPSPRLIYSMWDYYSFSLFKKIKKIKKKITTKRKRQMGWLWHIFGAAVRVPPSQTFHKEILQLCNEGPLNAWLWAKIDMVSNNCLLLHAAKKNRIQTSLCVCMCVGGWVCMCICLLLMSTRVCGHVL